LFPGDSEGWPAERSSDLPEEKAGGALQPLKAEPLMLVSRILSKSFVFIPAVLLLIGTAIGRGRAADGAGVDQLVVARLQYGGGGDWYNDRSILPNLMREVKQRTEIETAEQEVIVKLTDAELFQYPFLFMTGHGNVTFDQEEAERLRLYLASGGFLYIDDDYGMDEAIRRELRKVFPDQELVELPFDHPIYHLLYDFPDGLPKIHEHNNKPPQGFGLFHQGRLVLFYTYETNISDGWADPDVHGDPQEIRELAFRMGINILLYAMLF
jgi:hypothetical protein